jgi:hypothetical protein
MKIHIHKNNSMPKKLFGIYRMSFFGITIFFLGPFAIEIKRKHYPYSDYTE